MEKGTSNYRVWPAVFLTILSAVLTVPSGNAASCADLFRLPRFEFSPDPFSFSNPQEISVVDIKLDLTVNFKTRQLEGKTTLMLERNSSSNTLVLDTKGLTIKKVRLGRSKKEAEWRLEESDDILGEELVIQVKGNTKTVTVEYVTSPNAPGITWSKRGSKPYLGTLNQPLDARTWMPIQDNSQVRVTFSGTIRTPPELGLMALMSAPNNPHSVNKSGVYRFKMNQAIPSYLIALVVGELAYQKIGPRTGVYSHPKDKKDAGRTFVDAEKILQIVESLVGRFPWKKQDIVVLPGYEYEDVGMEHPYIITYRGDVLRSDITSLHAHEQTHSWSGNSTTYANMNVLFLNEGLTTFVEQLALAVHQRSPKAADRVLRRGLAAAVGFSDQTKRKHPRDVLVQNMAGLDPKIEYFDDPIGFNAAYTKGALFFNRIAEIVGIERFLQFTRKYLEDFKMTSVTDAMFIEYLEANLLSENPKWKSQLRLHEWLYRPGIPTNAREYNSVISDAFLKKYALPE